MIRITPSDTIIDVTEKVQADDPTLTYEAAQNRALALVQARKRALAGASAGAPTPVRTLHADGPPVVAIDPAAGIIAIQDRVREAFPYASDAEVMTKALALSAARSAALAPPTPTTLLDEVDAIMASDASLSHAAAQNLALKKRAARALDADRETVRRHLKAHPTTGPDGIAHLIGSTRERATLLINQIEGRA